MLKDKGYGYLNFFYGSEALTDDVIDRVVKKIQQALNQGDARLIEGSSLKEELEMMGRCLRYQLSWKEGVEGAVVLSLNFVGVSFKGVECFFHLGEVMLSRESLLSEGVSALIEISNKAEESCGLEIADLEQLPLSRG